MAKKEVFSNKKPQKRKCGNCGKQEFKRLDGIYALTEVVKENDDNLTFKPASGIPIAVFICVHCGDLKLIPAKMLGEI